MSIHIKKGLCRKFKPMCIRFDCQFPELLTTEYPHSKNVFCSLDKDLCHVNSQRRKQVLSVSILPSPCNKAVSLFQPHGSIRQMKLLQGHNPGITVI